MISPILWMAGSSFQWSPTVPIICIGAGDDVDAEVIAAIMCGVKKHVQRQKKTCVGNEYFSKGMLMVALVRWSHYLINDAYSLQPWNSTCKLLPSKEKSNPLARLHDVHKAQCTRNKAQGCTMYDGKTKQSIKISKGDKGFLPMRWSFGRIRRSIKMKQRISSQWTCG